MEVKETSGAVSRRLRVSLEVNSSSQSLSEIEGILGASGDESWSRGDTFVGRNGRLQKRQQTYWSIFAESNTTIDIESVIEQVIKRVEALSDRIESLPPDVTVALCIWLDWYPGDSALGFHLDAKTVAVLKEIGAELDLDTAIYCPP